MSSHKHKFALLILIILVAVNGFIIFKTLFTGEIDLWVSRVKEKVTDGARHYQILLQSSKDTDPTTVTFHFEDGSTEIRSVLEERKERLDLRTSKRLEHITLNTPQSVEEPDTTNNQHQFNLWSGDISLMQLANIPDYAFTVDSTNHTWFVASGRGAENEKPAVFLSVLAADGSTLLDRVKLSPEGIYSVYPVIQRMDDGKIHILWSSYIEGIDYIYHVTYSLVDGKPVQEKTESINEGDVALIRPILIDNDHGNPHVLVLAKRQVFYGFALYKITDSGLEKIPSPVYAETGETYRDICFFRALPIKDVVFMLDSSKNFSVIWDEIDASGLGVFYMTKFDPSYHSLLQRKDIGKILAMQIQPRLEVVLHDHKFHLFYTREFNMLQRSNEICYTLVHEDGTILNEDVRLEGPSPVMVRDLTIDENPAGDFSLVWTDARVSKATRPNRDLVFKQINPDFETLVPTQQLSTNLIDQMMPKLRYFNGYRYLAWADLKDGQYQLYMKSTEPTVASAMLEQQKWDSFWEGAFHLISVALVSIGAQLLFLFPLNLFPFVGALAVMYLLSTHKIRDHWINWLSIFLTLLLLKFVNLSFLSKTSILTLSGTYKLTLATFGLTLLVFFAVHQGWKKWTASALRKSSYLFGWLILDTVILTLIYYFQRI